MGTIVCQTCDRTLDHFEDEKVSTLYGVCSNCQECTAGTVENRAEYGELME